MKIIIGTRGSDLALWQANFTKDLLEKNGHEVELKIIQTSGDRSQQWNTSFDKIEGKGFFTKELEDELLAGSIHLAVHSHKDLPTTSPERLIIAGVSKREDPSELLIIRKEAVDENKKFSLKENAIVGTSSARRKSQLLAFRPDVEIRDLRGNVPTRVKKLGDKQYDAILLANAGIERLGLDLSEFHTEKLSPYEFVPPPAQGVLAWQIREDNSELLTVIEKLNDLDVQIQISIERRILNLLDGGCQLPLGAYCEAERDEEERFKFKLWLSLSDKWDTQPKQLYFETYHTDDFAERVISQVQNISPKKVFITKNLREKDYLPRALKNLGFNAEGKSLIEFKHIPIAEVPKTDWIFFSSKHAVKYFFNQKPQLGDVKIGCVGKATADELRAFGKRAQFIGQSTDTKLIGKQFSSLVGNSKVLFPIAADSLQSIQNQIIKKENIINLPVYKTIKHSETIPPDNEIIVFTSPSNVEAFFEKNKFSSAQKAVAMGDATQNALMRKKVGERQIVKTTSFDDLGLFRAILQLSC
jgi:hydroxymethylbilane synthase